jgi:phosphoglycolate phosphatase
LIIFFDFDGTIVDTAEAKLASFKKVFNKYASQYRRRINDYLDGTQGVPRSIRFKHIYKNILSLELDERETQRLSNELDVFIKASLGRPRALGGIDNFLSSYSSLGNFYIVSAAPRYEILAILNQLGLEKYFSNVFGSETSKVKAMTAIMIDNPSETKFYMIGDTINDLVAADEVNVSFIAFGSDQELRAKALSSINHYSELPKIIDL